MSESSEHTTRPLENVFVVYPKHLKWLMEDNKLTVSEICVALGMPSLQEWYSIIKYPDKPVQNTRIVQNVRLYLRKPSLLPIKKTPLKELIARTEAVFNDESLARRLLEAAFHKQWSAIESWLYDDELSIDFSARRLAILLMELDDEEFRTALLDAAVSTHAQVKAEEIETHEVEGSKERLYFSPLLGKMTVHKETEYVMPAINSHQFQSQVAEARSRADDDDQASELPEEAQKAIQMAPWNQIKKPASQEAE